MCDDLQKSLHENYFSGYYNSRWYKVRSSNEDFGDGVQFSTIRSFFQSYGVLVSPEVVAYTLILLINIHKICYFEKME